MAQVPGNCPVLEEACLLGVPRDNKSTFSSTASASLTPHKGKHLFGAEPLESPLEKIFSILWFLPSAVHPANQLEIQTWIPLHVGDPGTRVGSTTGECESHLAPE